MTQQNIEQSIRLLSAQIKGLQLRLNEDLGDVFTKDSSKSEMMNRLNKLSRSPNGRLDPEPGEGHTTLGELRALRQESINMMRSTGSLTNDLNDSLRNKIADLDNRGLSTQRDEAGHITPSDIAQAARDMLSSAEVHLDGGKVQISVRVSSQCRIYAEGGFQDGNAVFDAGIKCDL